MVWDKTRAAVLAGEHLLARFFPAGTQSEVPGMLTWSVDGARVQLLGPTMGWPTDLGGEPFPVWGYTPDGDHFTLPDAWINKLAMFDGPKGLFSSTLALGEFTTPDERWPAASFSTGHLAEWRDDTGLSYSRPRRSPDGTFRVEWSPPQKIELRLPGAQVTFTGRVDSKVSNEPSWSIDTDQTMAVRVRRQVTAEQFHDRFANPLVSLTCLVSDRPDTLTREVYFDRDRRRRIEMVRSGHEFRPRPWRPIDDVFLFAASDLKDFSRAIRKWWRLHEDTNPALGLFADHVREGKSFSWPRFLTLYTAVEAYSRERVGRNSLRELRDYAGVADEVTACTDKAVALIGVTRKYLAHLGTPQPFTDDYIQETVPDSTRRLSALMQACLMRDLGFGTRAITSRIRRFYERWPLPLLDDGEND